MSGVIKENVPEEHFGYKRVSEREVINAVKDIKATMEEIQLSWDQEVAKYEETIDVPTASGMKRLARRNYPNNEGTIADESLFPYHSSCYALLDAYDGLGDGYTPCKGVILPIDPPDPENDDRVSRLDDSAATPPSYLPNSTAALFRSFQSLLDENASCRAVGLKLLKHSMSDMQCDHEMSAHLVEFLCREACIDEIEGYRRLIATFLLERRVCNGRCYSLDDADDADHFCKHWQNFELKVARALVFGVKTFTAQHAHLLCAFFKITFDLANPSAGEKEDEIVTNGGSSTLKSRKTKLKQALYLWNQTDFDDEGSDSDDDRKEVIPYAMMHDIATSLSYKFGRKKFLKAQTDASEVSFSNSAGALVYIGEASVRRLPAKSDSIEFCSKVVFSFVEMYTGFAFPDGDDIPDADECSLVCGAISRVYSQEINFPSLINPDRYATSISNATKRFLSRLETSRARLVNGGVNTAKRGTPQAPQDVFDVVRSLYGRDLVDVKKARCGYGDFFVWLGGEITARDPFLFVHNYNFPVDIEVESKAWIADENGRKLLDPDLFARYDFTLVKLLQAWNAPWSPDNHHSYQPQFRAATKALVMCAGRVGLPMDIVFHITKFLPRAAWPDERARCWCDDCAVDGAVSLMAWKLGGKKPDQAPKLHTMKDCSCRVAMYKSSEHRKNNAGQHRRGCNKVPLSLPGREEEILCQIIDAKARGEEIDFDEAMLVDGDEADDDDDEGSWESMDSDEEDDDGKPQSITDVIFDYFNRKSYKLRHTEESAFEAMYATREE